MVFCRAEGSLCLAKLCLVHRKGVGSHVIVVLADNLLCQKLLLVVYGELLGLYACLCHVNGSLCLVNGSLILCGIDNEQRLSGMYKVAFVHKLAGDVAAYLRTDFNVLDTFDGRRILCAEVGR